MIKLSIIQRNKSQGNKTWYLRTFDTETKEIRYKSLDTTKKAEALDALINERQIFQKSPEAQRLERLPDLKTLAEKYLKYIETHDSPNTYSHYSGRMKEFLKFAKDNGVSQFKQFTIALANDLVNGRNDLKPATKKNTKSVNLSFFNWVIETYELECKNVFGKVKPPKLHEPIKGFWTPDEIVRILEATGNPQMRLCFAFMAYAGLRVTEALNLEWGHIGEDHIEVINGKGGKNVRLPMSRLLHNEIAFYLEDSGKERTSGKIFSINSRLSVLDSVKRICKKIGLEGDAHPHKFRHSFASNLLRAGANIVAVSKLMRHQTPTITLNTYSHVVPNDLEKTLELLEKKE